MTDLIGHKEAKMWMTRQEVPPGYHLEIRRCLTPRCGGDAHKMADISWERVECFPDFDTLPSRDEFMTRLFAGRYPHVWVVLLLDAHCGRPLLERVGGE